VDLRSELTGATAERKVLEREVHDQLLQLHALQLQLHGKQGLAEDSNAIKDRLVGRGKRSTTVNNTTTFVLFVWHVALFGRTSIDTEGRGRQPGGVTWC